MASTTNLYTGNVLTSDGTASTWTATSSTIASNTVMTIPASGDKVVFDKKATLEVKGNLVMNGIDLEERLSTIEKVLHIPERDVTLEAKHPRLKKLYNEYITALEEYRTWQRLKGDDND